MQNTKKVKTDKQQKGLFQRMAEEVSKNRILYIMSIPILLYFILFCYLPMFGLVIAFKDYSIAKGILASPWVGFKHFKSFIDSIYFLRTIKNTLMISFGDLIISFPMPIIFALLLNEIRNQKFKKTVQTISYLPHFISLVVICGMISDFFSTEGVMTYIITLFGGEKINYLGDAQYFRSIYIGTNIWQSIGWSSIIYLAALTSIDSQLYEAAVLDGAGKLRQLWHITLPGIRSTIIILLVMKMGRVLNVGYEKIILLYNPSTYETADVISSFVYRRGLQEGNQYGFASAVGLFSSVTNVMMLCLSNFLAKKFSDTSLF